MVTVGILTCSDAGSRGQRQDTSGQTIREMAEAQGFKVTRTEIVPDERTVIADRILRWAAEVDLVLTTGGTGMGQRDVTPEATRDVMEREAPGLAEAMRFVTAQKTPMAWLSRGTAGVRGRCLIINLPGSPKAVRECLEVVMPLIPHALETLHGPTNVHPAS
ncbi:MAG: MogA/MoaB family molybdenum cofactor biosynthesis protein [Dehalococcoidia bacterium]|nr:MogA/MoaB family molybdenum cofactor biosynthesis protein [Dehalococcoidia bacterium]